MNPGPDWLSPGDNAWQLVAATLVGLMSIPGIAVLYGGLVQKKWAVNTMLMAFTGFSLVLVVWVLWGFKMGFGEPQNLGPGILGAAVGKPRSILGADNQHQAVIPLLDGAMPKFRFPETHWLTSNSYSRRSPRCCSWAAWWAESTSRCG